MSDELNQMRIDLIEAIRTKGKEHEALAIRFAMEAVRNPSDEQAQITAARYVAIHDTRSGFASEAIELVNKHWPRSSEFERKA